MKPSIPMFIATMMGLAFFAASAFSQSKQRDIWGDAIMKQPFDKTPFRQVRIADCLNDVVGCGYTLSVLDSKARARAAKHGVKISEIGFVDPFFAYYDSKLLKKRNPHVPLGRLLRSSRSRSFS
ncbi:MAG: hypothetical protein HYX68_05355 [Planctomycetes bacterium]|nr:hypothetical protein [Planctomycetota bacterium]